MLNEPGIKIYPQYTGPYTVVFMFENNDYTFKMRRYIRNTTDLKCKKIGIYTAFCVFLIIVLLQVILYFTYIKPINNECNDIQYCCQTEINPFIQNNLTLSNSTQQNCIDHIDWCSVEGHNGLIDSKVDMCDKPNLLEKILSCFLMLPLFLLYCLGNCLVCCKNRYF